MCKEKSFNGSIELKVIKIKDNKNKDAPMCFENINEEKSFEELVMSRITKREVNGDSEFGYDSNNNEIYYKYSDGYEEWKEIMIKIII